MLKQKTLMLSKSLNISTFTASDGWLQRFKCRQGVRFLKITGEKLSSNPEFVYPFKEKFKEIIREHGLNSNQLYNANETGLYWQLLPDKTYVSINEKTAPGMKTSKKRITFLGCSNASGLHKLKPLIIGKSKTPRCFRNFKNPLIYRNTKNAWMTGQIFKDWFFENFVLEVKSFLRNMNLPQKAVLLLDNAPSHPSAEELKNADGKIFVMFLPPNVTPLNQPVDQNILRLTKLYYRNSLLSCVAASEESIGTALKKITLRDAILHLSSARDKLTPQTIIKCWNNVMPTTATSMNERFDDADDNVPLNILQHRWRNETEKENLDSIDSVIRDTISLLEEVAPAQYKSTDVEEWNEDVNKEGDRTESQEELDTSENEENEPPVITIPHATVIKALDTTIEWSKQNMIHISDIITLK
ncbi:jerky protein homolog-like [Anoplophora glabripennis]|uniref:jerky protein homolog-like n=1 Tax=Anoplophora glabripennis TaxID=217634 RepID=UPI000C7576DF|nr:jerky protein homolog-like [Anoplophora glabripennis]